jgi:hypothetical protein
MPPFRVCGACDLASVKLGPSPVLKQVCLVKYRGGLNRHDPIRLWRLSVQFRTDRVVTPIPSVTELQVMPRGRKPIGDHALSGAERQARFLARLRAPAPPAPMIKRRPLPKPRPRPARWNAAVAELVDLQSEYRDWLERLPEPLRDTPQADALQAICDLDLSEIENVVPPKGFGRD